MSSSSTLPICRIDWRPSRALAFAIGLLGLLAALSVFMSALPGPVAALSAMLALAHASMQARRELRREPFCLIWAGGGAQATLNFAGRAQSLSGPKLSLRGPLASLHGRDEQGRNQRFLWWPDTLPSAARRQLRLAMQIHDDSQPPASAQKNA